RDRWQLLLARLAGVPWQKRTARFRCVLALAVPGGATHTVEGTCEGFIALEPRGEKGFGYDPVFFLPGQQCTMAQLTSEAKNQISHRANAVRALRRILESYVAAGGLMSARQAPVPKAEGWDA
ncbi:MAG TPA: non-canonical purine NTP pyrophosphatase, partial [Anaerolineae bacterium]|nr:non-canonical purine NTP pyrophosphatase [Anaerolineae bacterium]